MLVVRAASVLAAAIASAVVGVMLVALATANSNGGVGWTVVGIAAAVGAVALVVRATRAE